MSAQSKIILSTIRKHAPTILSWIAVGGVVATGWLTHKAARKSDTDEPFKKHWKNYIPPVLAGAGTIACIVGANSAHLKVEAGMAGAVAFYKALSESQDDIAKTTTLPNGESAYSEFKKKSAYSAISKPENIEFEVYEPYTKQYFKTTQKEILWAELEANKLMSAKGTVKLNDILALYRECKQTPEGETIGWSWNEDWFNECASYYWHGGWIELTPQWEERNGKMEFIMEYGIQPMEITE